MCLLSDAVSKAGSRTVATESKTTVSVPRLVCLFLHAASTNASNTDKITVWDILFFKAGDFDDLFPDRET